MLQYNTWPRVTSPNPRFHWHPTPDTRPLFGTERQFLWQSGAARGGHCKKCFTHMPSH